MTALFDLNIEEVLENWEVPHAIREVISNALDERVLTDTKDIEISADERGDWHVRDFGRGLRIEHFTQNESPEKLSAETGVIGKFGVGLKDALATFHRRGVDVKVVSPHGTFTLTRAAKANFEGISTLHVAFDDTPNDMEGTDFVLSGVTGAQMDEAKALFLTFNDEEILESTRYGDVLLRKGDAAKVYISGVFAAEEPNFLFSYNVTHLTDAMRKRLNRERLNVGRTTYAERIRSILRAAEEPVVHEDLIDQILTRSAGNVRDEMAWIEIAQHALTLLHQTDNVLFVTDREMRRNPDLMDHARGDGLLIVVVTDAEKKKLLEQAAAGGPATRMFETYLKEFNESFEYTFVHPDDLSSREREIFELTGSFLALVAVSDDDAPTVLISETMRVTEDETEGVWDPQIPAIVIKRDRLKDAISFGATLLHEVAHAMSGALDATREFEMVLTHYLGATSTAALGREDRRTKVGLPPRGLG
ncbi:MAG TPA: ATP-binding protein [Actinomycetota bacterium]|nr:ATP-binding protein [Actinomycetota bacterium]